MAASMTNVAQVLVLLVCAFYIDRIGRRIWTIASFVAEGTLLAILGLAGTSAGAAERPAADWAAGAGAEGVWANALLLDATEPTPVADASRQTSVNERFIGIQNSF